jgi:hypothetical protein
MATVNNAFFNSNIFSILPTKCIYLFHIILTINNQLVFVIYMQCMFYEVQTQVVVLDEINASKG